MKIRFQKRFQKQYKKLPHTIQAKAHKITKIFKKDPTSPILRNHALKGEMAGMRAISVSGDVRIIFVEEGNYKKVIFVSIGTHNQVY